MRSILTICRAECDCSSFLFVWRSNSLRQKSLSSLQPQNCYRPHCLVSCWSRRGTAILCDIMCIRPTLSQMGKGKACCDSRVCGIIPADRFTVIEVCFYTNSAFIHKCDFLRAISFNNWHPFWFCLISNWISKFFKLVRLLIVNLPEQKAGMIPSWSFLLHFIRVFFLFLGKSLNTCKQ